MAPILKYEAEMEVKFCLLDVDYILENGLPVIRLWGKTSRGRSVVAFDRGFRPYFYIEPKDEADIGTIRKNLEELEVEREKITGMEETEKKILGKRKKFLKVTVTKPANVPKFRALVKDWEMLKKQYEFDIPFYRRYMIDRGFIPMNWIMVEGREIKSNLDADLTIEAEEIKPIILDSYPKFNIIAFDIEIIDENIIMVSLMDNRGFKKLITYGRKSEIKNTDFVGNEKELLEEFQRIIKERNPDIIVGYNTDRYDFVRLDEKTKHYKIPFALGRDTNDVFFIKRGRITSAYIRGRIHVDIFDFIENILDPSLATEVLTLDKVAKELLGTGKESLEWKDIERYWRQGDMETLAKYCLQDSELALKLAENLLPQIFELSRITGQTLFDSSRMTYSQLVEWSLMRKANEAGEISPNKPGYDEIMRRRKAEPYTGGYVHTPKEGIHENIALFDFASLYPSITITYNISPETLECSCCRTENPNRVPTHDHYYCSRKKGFITSVIEELVRKRLNIKRKMARTNPKTLKYKTLFNMQYALKILANAIYGYYGYAGSRWYSRICAESITAWGRMYIKKVINTARNMGLEVIYGDTDSLFLKSKTKKLVKEFLKKANDNLPELMELEFKGFYSSGIFVLGKTGVAAKKRYALLDSQGNLVIKGFEIVRRDWARIAKNTQEKVLLAVLRDKSPEKAVKIVRDIIDDLENSRVDINDLIIYTQITRPLDQYEQIGPHVAAAKKAKEYGKLVKQGSIIGYVISKGVGSISSRAEPVEFAKNYDPDYYINNQVIPAALRVLSGLGYTEWDLLKGSKEEQTSLYEYTKKI